MVTSQHKSKYSHTAPQFSLDITAMTEAKCGICGMPESDRKKRILLRGKTGESQCEIFLEYVASKCTDEWSVQEVNKRLNELPPQKEYMCSKCQGLAGKWKALQKQLADNEQLMHSRVKSLMQESQQPRQDEATSSKRQPLPHSLVPKRLKWGDGGSPELVVR